MKVLLLLLSPIRYGLFMLMLFLRPIACFVFGLGAMGCLVGFVFCLLLAREQQLPMYAFLGAGVLATAAMWTYDSVLSFLGPTDYILITEQ